jgi:hypothetical protein
LGALGDGFGAFLILIIRNYYIFKIILTGWVNFFTTSTELKHVLGKKPILGREIL